MTNNFNQQMQQMVDKGKQQTAGLVASGQMIIDADPEQGFFRVKLINVQPPEMTGQLTSVFCTVLAKGGAMFNIQTKQRVKQKKEEANG
jgi:hypothetical protein